MGKIGKGVLADGLATLISGALGAPGMNTAPSLVGVSSSTGVTSRAISFAAAGIFFLVAFSPKLASLMLRVPHEVAGAILVFTSSFMIAGGMDLMLARKTDTRTIIWKVPKEAREIAIGDVGDLLRYLARAYPKGLTGTLGARYDRQELGLDILHPSGELVPLPRVRGQFEPSLADELDNEEAAALVGLRNFLLELMADHKQVRLRHNLMRISSGTLFKFNDLKEQPRPR